MRKKDRILGCGIAFLFFIIVSSIISNSSSLNHIDEEIGERKDDTPILIV